MEIKKYPSKILYAKIASYIETHYVNSPKQDYPEALFQVSYEAERMLGSSLAEELTHLEESFSEMVLRKIDEKGITDVQCYKKANLDRKLFSRLRSRKNYKPSKKTALLLGLALELSLDEMDELLERAGYALSHADKRDIIIEYFIKNGLYDLDQINQALAAFQQKMLV